MESQVTTRVREAWEIEIILHNFLADWKAKHNKVRKYRIEDFCYDGFTYNLSSQSSTHSILYIVDYKYNDRQSRRRIGNMQYFISKHCLDENISHSSSSFIILNKTNSRCVDTAEYVKKFEKQILEEINIIRPTIIVCLRLL